MVFSRRLIYTGTFLGSIGLLTYNLDQAKPVRNLLSLTQAAIRITMVYKYSYGIKNDPSTALQVKQYQPANQADAQIVTKNIAASGILRDALRHNGGIYLKLGQLIGSLDVIVPDEFRANLSQLTRQCAVTPFDQVKATVESQLGQSIDKCFSSFEKQPMASASIAQVHRATMINGQKVAVKVQHHNLDKHVAYDLAMLTTFSRLAKWAFKDFQYGWLIEEFEKNLQKELDFCCEALNLQRLQTIINRRKTKNIRVPKLMFPATKKTLVMQFVDGYHIDQVSKMKAAGIDTFKIGKQFSKLMVCLIHQEGFVHADPHPGNLLVEKKTHQLVVLDHGLYQELAQKELANYNRFWLGLILRDEELYTSGALGLGTTNPKLLMSMLTSKPIDDLMDKKGNKLDLNPLADKAKIREYAQKGHANIVNVLNELNRDILLLLKVNQFARAIQNQLGGRPLGVYQDIAQACVNAMELPWYKRWMMYFRMAFVA